MTNLHLTILCILGWSNLVLANSDFPVAIQHLSSGDVTFPNDQCIQCRGDKLHLCLSARIECKKDDLAVEMLWFGSSRCEGPPNQISRSVPSNFLSCPGPEHFSPMNIDMDRFIPKLQQDFKDLFPNNETAKSAILEYRRMLILNQLYPDNSIVPSALVDKVWHTHILDTVAYHRDSLRMFGYYLHHSPSFGGKDEKKDLLVKHQGMLDKYQEHFGEDAPADVWPIVKKPRDLGHYLPNCCKAWCVKPDCSDLTTDSGDCVGCDPLHCGYDNEVTWDDETPQKPLTTTRVKQPLSPAQFGGYVPLERPELKKTFTVTPISKDGITMTFSWNITDDIINFVHTLKGLNAWYGMGFATGDDRMNSGVMGFADYMVTLYTKNYTGVYDLWKYNSGNDYPCFDTLYECSAGNKTMGTNDVMKVTVKRSGGTTTSSWSRKLSTGDSKDYTITKDTMYVMFAWGKNDYFTEHKKTHLCKLNMYTGPVKCDDDAFGLKAMRARLGKPIY